MLRKIQPGQTLDGIPADAWNAFVDAAVWVRGQQAAQRRGHGRDQLDTGIVAVKNSSGYDCSRFDVLGVDDWFPDPADNADAFKAGPVIHGITPSVPTHRGRFVILLEPCANGSICAGVIGGVTVAKVNMDAATDLFCEAKDGDRGSLQSGTYGSAAILRVESGTGVKWAVVRLGVPPNAPETYFELTTALAPGSYASAYPRPWNGSAYVTDAEASTFTVKDILSRFRGRARNYPTVTGSYGLAKYRNGQWEIEHLQPHAQRITCLANGAFVYSDTTVDVDNVTVVQPVDTALLMAAVTTVYNLHAWNGDDNATIQAIWNDDQERWDMVQVDCQT